MHLAKELKSLISWGASQHCLTRPTLRDLVLKHHPGVEGRELSQLICKQIETAAWKLPDGHAKAVLVLLRLRGHFDNARAAREEAIRLLGLHMSWETFRREPEWNLMQLLAEALQEPSEASWVAECEVVTQSPLELRIRLRTA